MFEKVNGGMTDDPGHGQVTIPGGMFDPVGAKDKQVRLVAQLKLLVGIVIVNQVNNWLVELFAEFNGSP